MDVSVNRMDRMERRGIGRALVDYFEHWAKKYRKDIGSRGFANHPRFHSSPVILNLFRCFLPRAIISSASCSKDLNGGVF